MTRSEKILNTKKLNTVAEHIADLKKEFTTQFPQITGFTYLHGEVITYRRINDSIEYYNKCVTRFNSYAKKSQQLPTMELANRTNLIQRTR
jgi:cytochrome c peroxidase